MPDAYLVITSATVDEWPEHRTFTGLRIMPGAPDGLYLGTSEGPHLWFEGWDDERLDDYREEIAGGATKLVIGGGTLTLSRA